MVRQALKHVESWAVSGNFDRVDSPLVYGTTEAFTNSTVTNLTSTTQLAFGGSPFLNGDVVQFAANAIISGGMFVSLSGTGPKVIPAIAASTPLGVATAIAQSGANVSILTHGFYYANANGNIATGDRIALGAAAAKNGVIADAVGSVSRGIACEAVNSGTAAPVLIYLW